MSDKRKIYDDGSIEGGFSSVKLPYPHVEYGETSEKYKERIDKLVEKGFHLGDLGWGDWAYYCSGSPNFSNESSTTSDDDDEYSLW